MRNADRKIRVLQISTYNEECGIGKFNEKVVDYLNKSGQVYSEYYPKSLNIIKQLPRKERSAVVKDIAEKSKSFDVVHLQHEFGLYASAGLGFGEIVRSLKRINKPTVVTIHTAPGLLLRGSKDKSDISIRTLRRKVSETLHNKRVFYTKLKPFQSVDKIVTFNKYTENQLMNTVKVPKERIYKTLLPVDDDKNKPNAKYRKELSLKQGDKLLAVAGFINPYKGFVDAVEAVAKLPSRYKLIILGGINPDSGNPEDLKHLESVIERLNVNDRVKISGFIKDDNLLSAYLKACDTALYPYSPEYYKMASSDAINKSIMNNVPVVAYPTDSFKEINKSVSGAITLTDSANVKALVEAIRQTSELKHSQSGQKLFREKHSYNKFATQMIGIYNEILVQN